MQFGVTFSVLMTVLVALPGCATDEAADDWNQEQQPEFACEEESAAVDVPTSIAGEESDAAEGAFSPGPIAIPELCSREEEQACCDECRANETEGMKGRVCCCTCEDVSGQIHYEVAVACSFVGNSGAGGAEAFPGQNAMDACVHAHEQGHIDDGEFYCVERPHGMMALWDPNADPPQNHENCEGNQYTEEENCLRAVDCSTYATQREQNECQHWIDQRADWYRDNNPDNSPPSSDPDKQACRANGNCLGPAASGAHHEREHHPGDQILACFPRGSSSAH